MARNKHPEETVEKILAVSAKLFMEKGFCITNEFWKKLDGIIFRILIGN